MKEHPILLKPHEVRGILDDRQTQIRRVIKHQPPEDCGKVFFDPKIYPVVTDKHGEDVPGEPFAGATLESGEWCTKLPFGNIGGRLWARETWTKAHCSLLTHEIFYRADGERQGRQGAFNYIEREKKWRPSIFMPRWASRITLEITDVRVERLNDISREDAAAEGICHMAEYNHPLIVQSNWPEQNFKLLWQSINGAGSWQVNPFVWAITFKRIPNDYAGDNA